MQNIDSYERGIHTSGQAARRLQRCFSILGLKVLYRAFTGFEAGIVFVSALQINDMIMNALAGSSFDYAQLTVICVLIFLSIVLSYVKEHINFDSTEVTETSSGANFIHRFYQ
jgi:hypothetical protein